MLIRGCVVQTTVSKVSPAVGASSLCHCLRPERSLTRSSERLLPVVKTTLRRKKRIGFFF